VLLWQGRVQADAWLLFQYRTLTGALDLSALPLPKRVCV
jgi:hypothetical protein